MAENLVDTVAPPKRENPPARTGDTVTVACKLPNGHHLDLYDTREEVREVGGVAVRERVAFRTGERYTVKGFAVDLALLAAGRMPPYQIAGGYGLTPGVPREHWELWLKQNADSALVRNHLIFAAPSEARARSEAIEKDAVRSGLEPIEPGRIGERTGLRNIQPDVAPGSERTA